MTKMTNSAKTSAITTVLFNKGVTPKYAMVLAAALIESQPEMEFGGERWEDAMIMNIHNTEMTVSGNMVTEWAIDGWKESLISCELATEEGLMGAYLAKLDEDKPLGRPLPASATRVFRNRPIKGRKSKLMAKAINALQESEFVVDTYILDVANKVFATIKCNEQYVVDGCRTLVSEGNVPVTSEFFDDARGRMYQGDCHGPNGQSSDMARAMMDLSGVPTTYNDEAAIKIILDEISDMISCTIEEAVQAWKMAGSAHQFIINCLNMTFVGVNKPWSFVKALRTKKLIEAGKKPYIGMAFGLDAKCSGPQLGALMTGDVKIAAACGFTNEITDDAYKLAADKCAEAGFGAIPRSAIKKPYMGVFYGQGKQAFMDVEKFDTKCVNSVTLLSILEAGPGADLEENGALFHKAIEASFGNMLALRAAIRKAHYTMDDDYNMVMLTNKATKHTMPDGVVVSMSYCNKVNIEGDVIQYGDDVVDVAVKLGLTSIEFKEMKLTNNEVSLYDYARAGFVNLIQATDALLARLIVSNLEDLGSKHIIAVHDCFRVNICDMIDGKLHSAIKQSYRDLFGSAANETSDLLPHGTDIMKMYFEGVNRAGAQCSEPSQFAFHPVKKLDVRKMRFVGKDSINSLIDNMANTLDQTGSSYFFAK